MLPVKIVHLEKSGWLNLNVVDEYNDINGTPQRSFNSVDPSMSIVNAFNELKCRNLLDDIHDIIIH